MELSLSLPVPRNNHLGRILNNLMFAASYGEDSSRHCCTTLVFYPPNLHSSPALFSPPLPVLSGCPGLRVTKSESSFLGIMVDFSTCIVLLKVWHPNPQRGRQQMPQIPQVEVVGVTIPLIESWRLCHNETFNSTWVGACLTRFVSPLALLTKLFPSGPKQPTRPTISQSNSPQTCHRCSIRVKLAFYSDYLCM